VTKRAILFRILRFSGLPLLVRELIQRRRVTILLFHDISRETAARTFDCLAARYHLLDLQTFIRQCQAKDRRLPPKSLILTFDDGHIRNYDLLPLFMEKKIPVTIFLCAGIIGTRRHFWFRHAAPKYRSSQLCAVPSVQRRRLLQEVGFTQEMEHDRPQALTRGQIEEMKPWVDFQSHTLFHPCLPRCSFAEARDEICGSGERLRQEYGLPVNAISYPHGDYSDRDIQLCRQAGYDCGVTVDCGYNTVRTDLLRLKRLPVNDTDDMNELIVKASGLWEFLKRALGRNHEYGWTEEVEP
jgi:peptidoglycan/xylan/chitin deacetylase (PgdA/CDA1 family)